MASELDLINGGCMVSNEEIRVRLECKRKGLDPEKEIQKRIEMEIPYEWVGDACVFYFDSMPVEDLSKYIKDLFEWWKYHLEEGTFVEGIYGRGSASKFLAYGLVLAAGGGVSGAAGMRFRFKVEIYSNGGKTFLEISKAIKGILSGAYYGFTGIAVLDAEFHRIIDEIKYLHPLFDGYLVCDMCNTYYKLQPGESPDDFVDKCECGGRLKYYDNIDWLLQKNKD